MKRVMAAAKALEPQIRAAIDTMESERRLPPSLVQALKEAGIFRMVVAQTYGGLEFAPTAQVRVISSSEKHTTGEHSV